MSTKTLVRDRIPVPGALFTFPGPILVPCPLLPVPGFGFAREASAARIERGAGNRDLGTAIGAGDVNVNRGPGTRTSSAQHLRRAGRALARRRHPALLAATAALSLTALPAAAQNQVLSADDGSMETMWSLTAPSAGPADWVGVAYDPPIEFPFRVVSASLNYLDTACCVGSSCTDAQCGGNFVDWDRMVIARDNRAVDAAGLTPDVQSPVALDLNVRCPAAGASAPTAPFTLTPYVWTLPAGTVFDAPGRIFVAVKYLDADTYMRFAVDDSSTNQGNSIHTSDGFNTRASIWAFGNVGMHVTIAPIFNFKLAPSPPPARFVLASDQSVTMLSVRVGGGPASTTITRVRVTAAGTGDDAADIATVRLVLDRDADGAESAGDTTLASGRFAANDGTLDLTLSRTLASGAAERWLVVYDLAGTASGGESFRTSVLLPSDVSSTQGTPYFSGSIAGQAVTIAGRLLASRGPLSMPSRIVQSGTAGLATLQIRLQAENEAMSVSSVALTADGTLDDTVGLSAVRLFVDADSSGTLSAPDILLASGPFPQDNGRRAYAFAPRTIAAGTTLDLIAVYDLAAAAPGGSNLRTLVALPTDVIASGAFSGPVPTTGPRALSGVPIVGNLATIGGALAAALAPANPSAGTAQPGATHVPLLAIALAASSEPVVLTALRFASSGSGDETTDVDRAELWRDTNQNGVVDGGDVRLGSPAVFAQNDGTLSFAFASETIPAGATRVLLLSYDFTTTPSGGQTFQAAVVDASAITASGQISLAPVTASGSFPLSSASRTLLGGFSLSLAPENPPATRAQPGSAAVPVLVLSVSAQGERFDVSELRVHAAGTLDDLGQVSNVELWRDLGAAGVRDAADQLLGSARYGSDDGAAILRFTPAIQLSAGTNERWLLSYDLSGGTPGQTFRATIGAAPDVVVSGSLSGPTTARGLPLVSQTHSIGGSLSVALAPSSPTGGVALPGQSNVPLIALRLSTNLEPITVSALILDTSGVGDDATGVRAARLYADLNRSGAFEAASDLLLGSAVPQSNDGPLAFSLAPRLIAAGSSEDWLVVYDLASSVSAGDSFALALSAANRVTASAPSGALFGVSGAPQSGSPLTVLGSLRLARAVTDPAARSVPRGAREVPILSVAPTAFGESFSVQRISVRGRGTADDVNDLVGLSWWADADQSGTVSPGDTRLAGPGRFAGDDGAIDFALAGLSVTPASAPSWLLTADLSSTAEPGRTFRVDVTATDVAATGFGGRAVQTLGLPLSSNLITVGGTVRVSRGSVPPRPEIVLRSDVGVGVLSLALAADLEPATLTGLTVHASGTGDDARGIAQLRLYVDSNANGAVDAGESLRATATFSADDGLAQLSLSEPIPPGAPLELLVVADYSASLLGSETFRISLDPMVDVAISSASSAVTVLGAPVLGPTHTVGGGFEVALAMSSPGPAAVGQSATDVGVLAATLRADNEICTVEALTITAAGSIDDARDLSRVRLFVDVDQNGILDFADLPLGGDAHFSADDGRLRFGGLARTIGRNAREQWLVVYDLSGTAHDQQSFRARISASDDLEVRCDVSGPTRASGAPIEGAAFTVEEIGALVLSRGDASPPPTFLPKGAVRASLLALRARAEVHDLVLDALTLTASTSAGAPADTVTSLELFVDENRDGRLDRGDRPLGTAAALDAAGRAHFGGLGLAVTTAEPVYLLATANVALSARPGARFAAVLAASSDVSARSSVGAVPTRGAPIASSSMTVAGDLTIAAASTATTGTAKNDDRGVVVLDLAITAFEERFTVEALTFTAEGSLSPSKGVAELSLVRDVDGDGRLGPGDTTLASGITFPEGSPRARAEGLSVPLAPGRPERWMVVADLAGTARTAETFTLSIAANVDVRARGDQVGAVSPVGGPVVGRTWVIAPSLRLLAAITATPDRLVAGDARDVVALALRLEAANEDATVSRISATAAGSLDDRTDVRAARLVLDQNGDGRLDPGDVEIQGNVRATADDGVYSFSPLAERVQKNQSKSYLVVVDLAGTGGAGKTQRLAIAQDADISALGSISGSISAVGAPLAGPLSTLVGALNVARGSASPAGIGVEPTQTFPALQLELFTVGETVEVSALALSLSGSADDPSAVASADLYVDEDGDGLAGPADRHLGTASPDGDDGRLSFMALALVLDASSTTRLLATLTLTAGASPGGTLRLGVKAGEDLRATGRQSGPVTAVGTPVQGSLFTIVRPFEPGPGAMTDGGCGCSSSDPKRSDLALTALALAGVWAALRRGRVKHRADRG